MGSEKKIQGEIALSYLERFPETPSTTLGKKMYSENKEVFDNEGRARDIIRYYRGASGKHNRDCLKDRRFIREIETPYNPYFIPESDELEFEPFEIYPQYKKILIFGDVHIPYHNVDSINRMIEYALTQNVDSILINGDFIDFHQLSQFVKDPRKRHFAEEIQLTQTFLNVLIKTFGVKIFYKLGNHEERYETYMKLKAPELIGINDFRLETILQVGLKNIDIINDKRIIRFGKLNILHGHEMKGSIIPPVNAARGVFLKTMENTLVNHFHTDTKHSENSLNGHHVSCWSIGCLCHDENTEILTESGFKFFANLINGEKVAQYDCQNNEIHYLEPKAYQKFAYNGDMFLFESRRLSQCTTPEHKMLTTRGEGDIKILTAKELYNRKKKLKMFISGYYNDGNWLYYNDERDYLLCELIGLIITDGSYRYDCDSVRLYQKVSYDRVKYLLDSLDIPYNVKQYSGRVPVFNISAKYGKIIKEINPEKNIISRRLLGLNQKCLKSLYEGLILGDGTRRSNNKTDTFYTHSHEMINRFQELCFKIGYSIVTDKRVGTGNNITEKEWYIYACNVRKFIKSDIKTQKTINYSGYVYDISTDYGFFVVRRNGVVSISGNCELHPEYAVINKWRHGFAIVEKVNDDGNFLVNSKQIIKGRVL